VVEQPISKGEETVWDDAPQHTLDEVVARGWVSADTVRAAADEYRSGTSTVSFTSFLMERGLLSADQVAELEAEQAGEESASVVIAPGAVFSGCVIERKLGQGGMGSVYLATRQSDGLKIVVKFLAAAYARNHNWRTRFLREAVVARQIDHPNVVRVYGVEVAGPRPHLVMELVTGQDLEELLDAGELPAPMELARIGRDVARGLVAAHAQGVVHRDVKPGNVRITDKGEIKILDFGLAKMVETDDGVSLAGQVLGTPFYMSPEQWGDHMVDSRSDIYSLGATLYHLLTGRPPYPGKRPMNICRKAALGKCPRPTELVKAVPLGLELAILRMMAVDRRARYKTAQDCVDALQAVIDGADVSVPCLTEEEGGRRHPLLPGSVFVLGRSVDADVRLDDPSASRTHARISFGRAGYQLLDLDSSCGTFVNEMRVHAVMLKQGDLLRFGALKLRFDDGGLATRQVRRDDAQGAGRLQVTTLPEPFIDALVEAEDRRVVIALLERLPREAIEARVESVRRLLRERFDPQFAEEASAAMRARLVERRKAADRCLFKITYENLRDDCDAWLTWWSEKYTSYPPQLGPQRFRPRIQLRVVSGAKPQAFELTERMSTTVGRGRTSDILLQERSLSRQHATVLRLHQRLMIRDDGSRYGIRVGDHAVTSAFLNPGERLTLGRVELVCEVEDLIAQPRTTPKGLLLVDPHVFEALVGLGHPSVVHGLLRFFPFCEDLDWVDRQAARLFEEAEKVQACARTVRDAYGNQMQRARELLPKLVPGLRPLAAGGDWRPWAAAVAAVAADLGPQVLPVGWFQPSG
jgi:serine/threonine protein kinase